MPKNFSDVNYSGISYRIFLPLVFLALVSCAGSFKLSGIRKTAASAEIGMRDSAPATLDTTALSAGKGADTVRIVDVDGKEMFLMSAERDSSGNMVASQRLEAAVVVSTFRNVAERDGRVDLPFQIIVPQSLHDRNWQLRYSPLMFMLGDSVALDKLVITGPMYRKRQLRGYQQYQRFLSTIITDSTAFINRQALEIFLRRNIPLLYAFKTDSSYVDDEAFYSVYGVNQRQALEHYTNHLARRFNDMKKGRRDKKFRQYVKSPIITEGIRLDTVLRSIEGNYVYNYVQSITTRPHLRKVDIVLDGEIFQQSDKIYTIPRSSPITFYISSLSTLADMSERYLTKVVERRLNATLAYNISFAGGSARIQPELAGNAAELGRIRAQMRTLLCGDVFALDSVVVLSSCSPEGSFASNAELSRKRSRSISAYVSAFVKEVTDSLKRERGVQLNLDETFTDAPSADIGPVPIRSSHIAEDWEYLDALVEEDPAMDGEARRQYLSCRDADDADLREKDMRRYPWYADVRQRLYHKLRRVQFRFSLSRRGMVKDTVHTTVIDTVYMAGLQALKDRDYHKALELLGPYEDYNTAVALLSLDRNLSAQAILRRCPKTAATEYMQALICSRLGHEQEAVQHYVNACSLNEQFVHRGNLDPEISRLIRKWGINNSLFK